MNTVTGGSPIKIWLPGNGSNSMVDQPAGLIRRLREHEKLASFPLREVLRFLQPQPSGHPAPVRKKHLKSRLFRRVGGTSLLLRIFSSLRREVVPHHEVVERLPGFLALCSKVETGAQRPAGLVIRGVAKVPNGWIQRIPNDAVDHRANHRRGQRRHGR